MVKINVERIVSDQKPANQTPPFHFSNSNFLLKKELNLFRIHFLLMFYILEFDEVEFLILFTTLMLY